ncbi:MAG: DEAD/DEAH box helicase, partial [Anaerotignum sp.]|nr:DEAD/DEAH box helicase [Anaerotignum sp.]
RVAEDTWSRESAKWDHLQELKISKILGTPIQRRKALASDADIYVINRENVVWLTEELEKTRQEWFFDVVVIDELSSFKNPQAKRFKALRKYITKAKRVIGLTGTPAPNGLLDLWSQVYLLDSGERLGKTVTGYRDRYFVPDKRNQMMVFSYKPKPEAEKAINEKIADICISMKAEDWLSLPEKMDILHPVRLSDKEMRDYEKFEREQYIEFMQGEVTALTSAALTGKLLQYSNGAMYLPEGGYAVVHDRKLDALEDVVESANGNPVLCFYEFRHDQERIMERFPDARILKNAKDIEDWNKGKVSLLLAHPAGAGHGLNLQDGGNIIVWFGLNWSLELYQQAVARLYRQGQLKPVMNIHLVTEGTRDELALKSLQNKKEVQDEILDYLNVKYGKTG